MTVDLQDVRLWGSEASPPGAVPDATLFDYSAGGFDAHQAYVTAHFGNSQVRVGRQELALDSQRLIGAVDWTLQGRSFDAIRAMWKSGKNQANIFAAMVRDSDAFMATGTPAPPNPDITVDESRHFTFNYVFNPNEGITTF